MTGIEPAPPGLPGALHELHSSSFVQRNTDTHCAPRQPGFRARTQGVPKEGGQIMVKQGKIKTRRDGYRDLRKRVACRMGRAAQTRSRHGMQSMQALRNPSLFAPSLMGFAAPSMAARVGRARYAALPILRAAHSAGCCAGCARPFSAPWTSTAIANVPTTKPSAMTAVVESTRSKP